MKAEMVGIVFLGMSVLLASSAIAATLSWEQSMEYCQILDTPPVSVCQVGLRFAPESRFEGYGQSAFLELEADWEFAYFKNVVLGDIDLNFKLRSILLLDSAELQLPDQVAKIALDAGWTWRKENGIALQLRTTPGIYSDLEEIDTDILFTPFSCSLIRAFNPKLSGIVGFELRPGFEREIMPVIGIEWEINDFLRLAAGLPESRFVCSITEDWSTHLGFNWQNTSFRLREKGDYDRDLITIEDFRAYWGLTHKISDQLMFTGELGYVFDRSVEFKDPAEGLASDVDIERAMFMRFALGVPF